MKLENAKLVKEFRRIRRCEMGCGRTIALDSLGRSHGLEVHHEPTWGSTGQETRLTLCRICEACHGPRHAGSRGKKAKDCIVDMICRREKCSREDRLKVIWLIWRAPKDSSLAWFDRESAEWPASAQGLLARVLDEAGVKR